MSLSRRIRIGVFAAGAVGMVFAASCKTPKSESGSAVLAVDQNLPLDVSDVSFLMPKPSQFWQFKATDSGPRGALLTQTEFAQIPNFVTRGHPGVNNVLNLLHITAFRFDPCAPQVSPSANLADCQLSLIRLVAQVFQGGSPTDAGIHLIYAVNASDREAIVEDLQNLKKASPVNTAGRPLGVHPGMQAAEQGSPASVAFANSVKNFILKWAGSAQLGSMATMVTLPGNLAPPGGGTTWEWQTFRKGANGQFTAQDITTVDPVNGAPAKAHQFTASGRNGRISPASKVVPQLAQILRQQPPNNAAALDASARIENPTLQTVPAGDCASCHVSTPGRIHAESSLGSQANLPSSYRAPSGITGSMGANERVLHANQFYVVLNFAYFFGQPAISQRTINESAEVVRLINTSIVKAPTDNGDITGKACFTGSTFQLTCPAGQVDGCLTGATQQHRCVQQGGGGDGQLTFQPLFTGNFIGPQQANFPIQPATPMTHIRARPQGNCNVQAVRVSPVFGQPTLRDSSDTNVFLVNGGNGGAVSLVQIDVSAGFLQQCQVVVEFANKPGPTPDPNQTPCPFGAGGVCGQNLGLNPNTLFQCVGGFAQKLQDCPNGCQINTGVADNCAQGGGGGTQTPCPFGAGGVCGANLGLDQNTLFQCVAGFAQKLQDCPNGCQINNGLPDSCAQGGGGGNDSAVILQSPPVQTPAFGQAATPFMIAQNPQSMRRVRVDVTPAAPGQKCLNRAVAVTFSESALVAVPLSMAPVPGAPNEFRNASGQSRTMAAAQVTTGSGILGQGGGQCIITIRKVQ